MTCKCCGFELASGIEVRLDEESGHTYKACPHCSATHGSEHVFHQYPYAFGLSTLKLMSANPNGFQAFCKECRALAMGQPSRSLSSGRICSSFKNHYGELNVTAT